MNLRRQGAAGEALAEAYLVERGAKVLARNFRGGRGEIDLIVKMDGVTVFVEVKQRTTLRFGTGAMAVDARKQQRISDAALYYMKTNKLIGTSARFDVVEINGGEIRHHKNAFEFRTR